MHSYAQGDSNLSTLLTKNIAPYNPRYGLSTAKAQGITYWCLWAIYWTFTSAAYGYVGIPGIGANVTRDSLRAMGIWQPSHHLPPLLRHAWCMGGRNLA